MKPTPIAKRSMIINGLKTSVSMEDIFWDKFKEIAQDKDIPCSKLAGTLREQYPEMNLSSVIRQHVLAEVLND